LREVFDLFDRDSDGKLLVQDIPLVIRSLGGNPTNAEMKDLISSADSSERGSIDFPAFKQLANKAINNMRNDDAIIAAFKQFDKDGKGTVSCVEIRTVLTTMGDVITADEVDKMIDEADPNKTGKIHYVEYAKILVDKIENKPM